MRLTGLGKFVIFILVVGIVIGGWRLWTKYTGGKSAGGGKGGGGSTTTTGEGGADKGGTATSSTADTGGEQGLLGRPLKVGVVSWPGYCGGIVGNNGFKPNKNCIYWNSHKLLVEFMLMEDIDARSKAFARGDVDVIWSTVDFWAYELPGFAKSGVKARAVMQVDWSRGGDAIVADNSIKRIEDLRGKKISLALFTPSHWLLEYSLENSSLDETEQVQIVKSLVGKNASPDARTDFVAGKVDAAVVWEPDVTEALKKRRNSHILVSSKTAANLIADIMVAREEFINKNPQVIKAFVQGWLDGTAEANRKPNLAARLLMENEPLYKELGEEETRKGLTTVKWADLVDNTKMFGLDGSAPLFDRIFRQASIAWVKRGYITQPVTSAEAKDDRFLKQTYTAIPKEARVEAPKEEFKFPAKPPEEKKTESGIMTKPVSIHFATGSAALDENAKTILDTVALTAQTYSNAYVRVEGNTDSVGNAQRNVALSERRAQSVISYLVAQYGFNRARFIAKGNGPYKAVAPNTTEAGRAKNRRTDVIVVPK